MENVKKINWIQKNQFVNEIFNIYKFGYTDNSKDLFQVMFKKEILDRLGPLYDLSKYILIEDDYIENEWKIMVSKHYMNSAYASSLKLHVIRVHFLSETKFEEKNYLGFITLRPINEMSLSLSFVYLNWNHSFLKTPSYVMTYEKAIHFKGFTITIQTYPFFSQDSIVTCCADVNIIMLTKYLSNKYKFKTVNMLDIMEAKKQYVRKMPRTVSLNDIKTIFDNLKIHYLQYYYKNDDDLDYMQQEIDSYIESAIPVLLFLSDHVIQLIGHTDNDNGDKQYIVYDDSGYLELKIALEHSKQKRFFYLTSIKKIKEYIKEIKSENFKKNVHTHIIIPIFDKVYTDIDTHTIRLNQYIERLGVNIDEKYRRNLLVDNSELKWYIKNKVLPYLKLKLKDKIDEFDDSYIINFLQSPLSHYIWYTEITGDDGDLCFCADPTVYYKTTDDFMLFMNFLPTPIDINDRLSLLTKSK